MSMLKPKVKAFGFTQKELKGVAAQIADNLTSEEGASDEDVNAEIEKSIDAVLPYLKIGQSVANRIINDSRKNDDEEDEDEDVEEESSKSSKSNRSTKNKGKKSDDEPEWFKAYRENVEKRLSDLAGERTSDKRKAKLEKLLQNTGKFGERKLRDYKRMKFESDDDFDEFFSEVEEDLKSENQERANNGLGKLGAPATGGGSGRKDKKETEVLSDDEIKEIAKM